AGGLQVIIHDLEWSWTVPATNSLRIRANLLEVRKIRVNDGCSARVERDAAARPDDRITMKIRSVEDDVLRQARRGPIRRSEEDQISQERPRCWADFHSNETVVMRAVCCGNHRP